METNHKHLCISGFRPSVTLSASLNVLSTTEPMRAYHPRQQYLCWVRWPDCPENHFCNSDGLTFVHKPVVRTRDFCRKRLEGSIFSEDSYEIRRQSQIRKQTKSNKCCQLLFSNLYLAFNGFLWEDLPSLTMLHQASYSQEWFWWMAYKKSEE